MTFNTFHTEIGRKTEDGGRILRTDGCDGVLHATSIEEIFFDENGKIEYAKPISRGEVRSCHGGCKHEGDLGFFRVEPEDLVN